MAEIDTSIYNRIQRPGQALSNIAQGIQGYRQNQMNALSMQQQQLKLQEQQRKQEKAEDFKRRQAQYQQALSLDPMMSPETKQDLESRIFQPEMLEQRLRSGLRGGGTKDNWIKLKDGWIMNKATGEKKFDPEVFGSVSISKQHEMDYKDKNLQSKLDIFEYKQENDLKNFKQNEQNDEEQIRQFEIKQKQTAIQNEREIKKLDWAQNKHKTMHQFKQKKQLQRLPKYISDTFADDRTLDAKDANKVIKLNDDFSSMYNKMGNIEEIIGSESDFIASKGVGETAKRAKSRIEKAVVQYNADVAELGALAGADLSMLRGIIPDPTSWSTLSYGAWKQTMADIKEDLKEEYQLTMNNSGFNLSGEVLGESIDRATVLNKSDKLSTDNQSTFDSLKSKYGVGN